MTRINPIKVLFVVLMLTAPASQAAVLDFEGFANGQIMDTEYQPLVTISTTNTGGGPNLGVIFDTTLSNTLDPDLEGPFNSNTIGLADNYDPGNVLIIQEHADSCSMGICSRPDDEGSRPAGWITFDFAQSIQLVSLDFFDIETVEDGATPNNRIRLYDAADSEVLANIYHTPPTGGDNLWDQLLFDAALHPELLSIGKVEVYMGGSGAIDNLVYNVVPIPATAWLFGTALLGFIGFARRTSI